MSNSGELYVKTHQSQYFQKLEKEFVVAIGRKPHPNPAVQWKSEILNYPTVQLGRCTLCKRYVNGQGNTTSLV